jgi:hypothetical protein
MSTGLTASTSTSTSPFPTAGGGGVSVGGGSDSRGQGEFGGGVAGGVMTHGGGRHEAVQRGKRVRGVLGGHAQVLVLGVFFPRAQGVV